MNNSNSDLLWEALGEHYEHICFLYRQFSDKHPVMLLDIQEQRIYAYPYREFAADLSRRSQASLARQYPAAVADGDMVVFVRDNVERRLVSYSVPTEQTRASAANPKRSRPARRIKRAPKPAASPGPRPEIRNRKSQIANRKS
jgi:hypothetical protein